MTFEQELRTLLNKHGIDNETHTPDYILSNLIFQQIQAYKKSVLENRKHIGIEKQLSVNLH